MLNPREPEEASDPASKKGKGKGKGKSRRDLELAKDTTAAADKSLAEGNTSRSGQKKTPRKGRNDGKDQARGEPIPSKL